MFFGLGKYIAEQINTFNQQMQTLSSDPAVRRYLVNQRQAALLRGMDLLFASVALVLTLPLLMTIGLLIKLDSPGPVLSQHKQMGMGGRLFTLYSFRTRTIDAEAHDTRIGRLLRQANLDELPQLVNIIQGDINLIAPQPALRWAVDDYEAWQSQCVQALRHVTGWWQVQGQNDRFPWLTSGKIQSINQPRSFWLDLYLIVLVIALLFKPNGPV